ncbi:hypothetical protein AA313_de0206447 [Arthrobotrys entomopaga]|nr:hypothetical protein AA313_de0206447 [Arthrobotrys entomopaga]
MFLSSRTRIYYLSGSALFLLTLLYVLRLRTWRATGNIPLTLSSLQEGGQLDSKQLGKSLFLSSEQCETYFPGLYREIDDSLARGPFGPLKPVGRSGYITARIHDGERHQATLHAANQALRTSLEPLPNVLLPFLLNDHPSGNMITLARSPAPKEINSTFLMPDYAFWSWPELKIGAWTEARARIAAVDTQYGFKSKSNVAIWRGTVGFNSGIRGKLVAATKNQTWADVQEIKWGKNSLAIEDYCRYKYLLYTEGVTYSGRLAYFTQCRSVIITTPFKWFQHYTHLFNPNPGPDQNIVFVKKDWSDLESTIAALEENPKMAEKIADNLVKTFRDRYLTPAANNCYWKRLIRAYAQATMGSHEHDEVDMTNRGLKFESFALTNSIK